jgi:hypothetical protein
LEDERASAEDFVAFGLAEADELAFDRLPLVQGGLRHPVGGDEDRPVVVGDVEPAGAAVLRPGKARSARFGLSPK